MYQSNKMKDRQHQYIYVCISFGYFADYLENYKAVQRCFALIISASVRDSITSWLFQSNLNLDIWKQYTVLFVYIDHTNFLNDNFKCSITYLGTKSLLEGRVTLRKKIKVCLWNTMPRRQQSPKSYF